MGTPDSRRVWDLPLRITHWLLVLGMTGAYVTHQAGVTYFQYHVWFGYLVVVLAVFRIVWGFVGTRHARFSRFLRGPRATLRYLLSVLRGTAAEHPGHNPLGAWMVIFLLVALAAQGITGLFANDEIFNTGPLYGYVSDALSLRLTSWHRRIFDWLLIAVFLHVAAVIAHRLIAKHNLVGPMFTGRKHARHVSDADVIYSSRLWLAVIVLAALATALAWLVTGAPEPAALGFE